MPLVRAAGGSGDALEMLQVDFAVEAKPGLELGHDIGATGEDVINVVAGFEVAGVVGELTAAELGNLVDCAAFGFDFLGNGAHEFVESSIQGLGVKDD